MTLVLASVLLMFMVTELLEAFDSPVESTPLVVTKAASVAVKVRADESVTVVAPSTSVAVPDVDEAAEVKVVHLDCIEPDVMPVIVELTGTPIFSYVSVLAHLLDALLDAFRVLVDDRLPTGLPVAPSQAMVTLEPGVVVNDCASLRKAKVTVSVDIPARL